MDESEREQLKGKLRIGFHWDVEVTDGDVGTFVSQAFCSALPVRYWGLVPGKAQRFASLVLEAAYEATLLAAAINRTRTGIATVFLTSLGGGAFGNDRRWIESAMMNAIDRVRDAALDVRLVTYSGKPA